MAGGPILPSSAVPVTAGKVFPNVHVGAGSGSKHEEGMGVMASLDGNAIWRLRFWCPPALPTGTGKLRLVALANATSGDAKLTPSWASVAAEEAPDAATLQTEGSQTLSWAAGDNDQYKVLDVTLDADTLVAGEYIAMDVTFNNTNWTLAAISTWKAALVWE